MAYAGLTDGVCGLGWLAISPPVASQPTGLDGYFQEHFCDSPGCAGSNEGISAQTAAGWATVCMNSLQASLCCLRMQAQLKSRRTRAPEAENKARHP